MVKGLFSSISAGDDIFPTLQEEIEKNSAFLGLTFLDLGRNLEALTDWSHWQLSLWICYTESLQTRTAEFVSNAKCYLYK